MSEALTSRYDYGCYLTWLEVRYYLLLLAASVTNMRFSFDTSFSLKSRIDLEWLATRNCGEEAGSDVSEVGKFRNIIVRDVWCRSKRRGLYRARFFIQPNPGVVSQLGTSLGEFLATEDRNISRRESHSIF